MKKMFGYFLEPNVDHLVVRRNEYYGNITDVQTFPNKYFVLFVLPRTGQMHWLFEINKDKFDENGICINNNSFENCEYNYKSFKYEGFFIYDDESDEKEIKKRIEQLKKDVDSLFDPIAKNLIEKYKQFEKEWLGDGDERKRKVKEKLKGKLKQLMFEVDCCDGIHASQYEKVEKEAEELEKEIDLI